MKTPMKFLVETTVELWMFVGALLALLALLAVMAAPFVLTVLLVEVLFWLGLLPQY